MNIREIPLVSDTGVRHWCLTPIMVVCMTVFCLNVCQPRADAAFLLGQRSTLKKVITLFQQENYSQIYRMFLYRIPAFNLKSKTSEELFYYYALTCVYLGKFDEAEGYLYTVRTKKQLLDNPARYELCWAQLKDFRGEHADAYDKYLYFVRLYPDHEMVPYAYYRIGNLALAQGLFERAAFFFNYLIDNYPLSTFAQKIKRTDDVGLKNYAIVLGEFEMPEAANARVSQLSLEGVNARVHITTKWDHIYYLVCVGEYLHRSNAEIGLEHYLPVYDRASIYPPLVEVKVSEE
ncbi:MAG: SPOR domain-containing protein [Candidatus Omnitrophica bacterium]|nr:SPOR domain-containing protein [Candidatus Omnitrophota bacterium]